MEFHSNSWTMTLEVTLFLLALLHCCCGVDGHRVSLTYDQCPADDRQCMNDVWKHLVAEKLDKEKKDLGVDVFRYDYHSHRWQDAPVNHNNELTVPTPIRPVGKEKNKNNLSNRLVDPNAQNVSNSIPSMEPTNHHVGTKPHILVFLMDDLGYYDVGYADMFDQKPRNQALASTPFITKLAKEEGIVLTRHYASWHCSPSRRSFLTGRWPVHSGGDDLTDFVDDDLDVRFTWISEKLDSAGYHGLFYGKGHFGTPSVKNLPVHRGFKHHEGFLGGSMTYTSKVRWENTRPSKRGGFSTQSWGRSMNKEIENVLKRSPSTPIFLFSSMQAPHSPLMRPPGQYKSPVRGMKCSKKPKKGTQEDCLDWNMFAADVEIEKTVNLFRENSEVWANTLVVFVSDNGGTQVNSEGSNYPLRGEKGTSFEGGFRVTGFVSGGIIPVHLRGTSNHVISHIADWYTTFCNLAGVDPSDDPPEPPLHPGMTTDDVDDPQHPGFKLPDPANPSIQSLESVWGENSYPPIDSKDLWPVLMNPEAYAMDGLHAHLVLSNEVIIQGHSKLIIAQPCSKGISGEKDCKPEAKYGWIIRNRYTWEDPVEPMETGCLKTFDWRVAPSESITFEPCMFNLTSDLREMRPIVDNTLRDQLWRILNNTLVYQYNRRLPGKEAGVSPPRCLGPCVNPVEATRFFRVSKDTPVPMCGLDYVDNIDHKFC